MKISRCLMMAFLFLSVAVHAQEKKKTNADSVQVVDKSTRATVLADSVAKAELKKYQSEHPGRLTRGQLSLVTYDRTLNAAFKGQNDYYLFDYDYNRDLGGLVYLIHFSVMVNTKSGRTVFKAQ